MKFPQITISGKPDDRGYAHGEALSSEIEATIDFYARIFKKSSVEILDLAKHFRSVIHEYNPAYCEEIESILVYHKFEVIGWCALAHKSRFPALLRPSIL